MAKNELLTPKIIAKESLRQFESNTVMPGLVYRDYASEFTAAKRGDTISIRKPTTFEAQDFAGNINVQNIKEQGVTLTLDQHLDVSTSVDSKEWTLSLDDFSNRVILPAMIALNEKVDRYLCSLYRQFNQVVGTPGTQPTSIADLANLDKAMNEARIPVRGRRVVVSPSTKASLMSIAEVVRADARGDDGTALREASMGRIMGMDCYMDQNICSHTAGTAQAVTALAINGNTDAGKDTISVKGGSGTETLLAGDVFTVAGASGSYTVVEDATAVAGAFNAVRISPAVPAGGFADGAAITLEKSHVANIAFVREAIALAVVPLEMPQGATDNAYTASYNGLSIRVVQGYDINTKTDTISFDMLLGAKVIDPRLGVRWAA